MKNKWVKLILPIVGIGTIAASLVFTSSCSENGLPPKTISQILKVYRDEATQGSDEENIINVNTIGDFPTDTPNATDIRIANEENPDKNSQDYKNAVADATAWADQITAPMKTYINNNITSGKSLTGDDDSKITQINGYKSFREQYFTVHLSNIYASKISETNDTLEWVFESASSSMQDSKKFTCLQNENDNAQWRKNSSYSGSDYENNNPQQIPSYVKDDSKDKYWELNLLNLWNRALFNPVPDGNKYQPYFRPFSKGTSSETIVTINYLVTFSPKPWVNEAPPIAFYVYADLRCWGISD